ncbi:MAG: DUF378 domain-containing protein [Candidatus Nanohaloarchaeota archaeon QJJ-7]|nr:DUF378 domain-containing protein [Candidatus Nanohaloarchaeota archaeon QJJ-7]
MREDDPVGLVSLILIIVGALNWGLVGLGGFIGSDLNVVDIVFAQALGLGVLADLIYLLVGIAGLYEIYHAVEM